MISLTPSKDNLDTHIRPDTDDEQIGNACLSSGNAYFYKSCDDVRDNHADMKNWYSPIMMERFGRGNAIKTEEQGGEEEVEDGIRKATFGSASACARVRGKSFRHVELQGRIKCGGLTLDTRRPGGSLRE
ncbi:hypothetical protein J6590_103636 [Homalodisca vitripennis]|nr:hypothetical protein J6590_103636 [Homalodisca vitripennis]